MDESPRRRWLAFPRVLWLSLAAALVLALPTVGLGFFNDDYYHLLVLEEGPVVPGSRFDLFRFASGDADETTYLMTQGPYPWWTLPELKLAFWRPLSSALTALDHRLFERAAVGWHLHSLLWYLGTVAVVGGLLRRLLPGAVGALALLLFALDGAHFLVVAWLANRNALVAALPALLGLWMHLEWREHQRPGALPLSILGFAVGLMGGEGALGVMAYVGAYELWGNPEGRRERLAALAPLGLLAGTYLGLYKLYGYGAYGSGSYMDPLGEPGRYLLGVLARVPVLVGGLVLELPSDVWALDARTRGWLVGLGVLTLGLFGWLWRATWPQLTEEERRHCRWLLPGAALALLPVAATFPSQRLLLVPGVGGLVAVAAILVTAWRSRERGWRPRGVAVGAGLVALAHLVVAPLWWPLMTWSFQEMDRQVARSVESVEGAVDGEKLPEQRVVTLACPLPTLTMYLPSVLAARGMPMPRAWWPLSMSPLPQQLTRTGEAAFELSLSEGRFLTSEFEAIFRGPGHPLVQGATVELAGMKVTVLEADEEGPRRLGFELDAPLEDPSWVFLSWKDEALRPFTFPPVGQRVSL